MPSAAEGCDLISVARPAGLLRHYPRIGRHHRGVHRKLLMPDHPYGVFYALESARVVIVAVLDLRQDPKAIEKRLGSD